MPNKADSGKSAMTANPFDWGRRWFDLSIKAQQAMTALLETQTRSGDLPTQLTQAASAAFGKMYLSLMGDPVALASAHRSDAPARRNVAGRLQTRRRGRADSDVQAAGSAL